MYENVSFPTVFTAHSDIWFHPFSDRGMGDGPVSRDGNILKMSPLLRSHPFDPHEVGIFEGIYCGLSLSASIPLLAMELSASGRGSS